MAKEMVVTHREVDLLIKSGMNPIVGQWGIDESMYNKLVWSLAGAIKSKFEQSYKAGAYSIGETMTPEERAEAVGALLDDRLRKKELTAAELAQFKDLFNLRQKDQDIKIESVDYREVDLTVAEIIECVKRQIMEYNKE